MSGKRRPHPPCPVVKLQQQTETSVHCCSTSNSGIYLLVLHLKSRDGVSVAVSSEVDDIYFALKRIKENTSGLIGNMLLLCLPLALESI